MKKYKINLNKKKMKEFDDSGITLIALVITVIIILILAAVVISMGISGEGVANKASNAVEKWNKKVAGQSNTINDILENAFKESYSTYTLGEEITIGGENFFVISENDDSSKDTITVIAKYCLNTAEGNIQQDVLYNSDLYVDFCQNPDSNSSTGYWDSAELTYPYDLNDLQSDMATAINIAKSYGTSKGGEGRLLTYEEAMNLKDKAEDIIFGKYSSAGRLMYYLGTAQNYQNIYDVFYDTTFGGQVDYVYFGYGAQCGIRPVITILKNNI